ncbi:MAG: heavy metal translocating P-type ATPase, partial [bacterium]
MMRTTIELAVKGPDCAVCADKINEKINKIEDVKSASLNAASGILIIELADENSRDRVIERTKKIISRIEPDAAVSERTERKNIKKELILEGLDCANCASEIENKTAKLDGVKSARIDFAAGKLVLELNSRDADSVIESIKKLIKKIEPDAAVKETAHKARGDRGESAAESRKKLFRLALSGSLFAAALIFTFSNQWEFALFFASYLIAGGKVILRAAKDIKNGRLFDESFLMSIATIGAFVLGAYAEGAAVMLFYQTGMFFQDSAVNRSRRSISALMDIRPDYAVLKAGNALKRVSPDEVKIGDFIIVKPGEKIPLDGAVVKGISMVDTSALTGEPVPLKAEPGSEVYGGSINKNGLLTIEVKKEFGESAVSKILRLVENAGSRKAPTEQFITKFARVYTPFVAAAALLLAVVPPLFIEGE